MKKLSEIDMDEYIYVGEIENLMTKGDYLSYYDADDEEAPIFVAVPMPATFRWNRIIEMFSDEQYEDWETDVYNAMESYPELEAAAEIMNKIFAENPTYYEGDEIENDMEKADV